MKYSKKLHQGVFLKRYKRFFADVDFKGQQVVAHVPNTGSMKGLNNPGQICLISETDNPDRKLKFTLEMIQAPNGAWVGVNTATPNTLVKETLLSVVANGHNGAFAHWTGFDEVKPEYKISAETRLDFALKKKQSDKIHFIEVKNVTLAEADRAQFPDAVSERAQKHIRELMALMEQGHTAELVFTVQRNDCTGFSPADHIDPEYGRLLREAQQKGLRVTPLVVNLTEESVVLSEVLLPVHL
jgi:sugar fermentation stimulation protein A